LQQLERDEKLQKECLESEEDEISLLESDEGERSDLEEI
jgi:hypothetical protein